MIICRSLEMERNHFMIADLNLELESIQWLTKVKIEFLHYRKNSFISGFCGMCGPCSCSASRKTTPATSALPGDKGSRELTRRWNLFLLLWLFSFHRILSSSMPAVYLLQLSHRKMMFITLFMPWFKFKHLRAYLDSKNSFYSLVCKFSLVC